MKKCAICDKEVEIENAPILTMGAYGVPKYLCDECAGDLDCATLGTDYGEISAAIERVGNKMSNFDPDGQTYMTVSKIMENSAARAKAIKEETYDFALDEEQKNEDDAFDELPEELLETEEDRELDRRDEEKQKLFDKIFNWISLGAVGAVLLFIIWRALDTWVF